MIQVYQDIVQPVVQFSWERAREHEPSRHFTSGSSQYVELAESPIIAPPMSMMSWINPDTLTGNIISLADSSVAGEWLRFALLSNGKIRASTSDTASGANDSNTIATISAGEWHLAGYTSSGTANRVAWLDAVAATSGNATRTPSGINTVSLGRMGDSTPDQYFNGRIFWPFVWDIVLTQADWDYLFTGIPPWWVKPESIVIGPNLATLYDPFIDVSFVNTNSTKDNPYRDWTLPDNTALWGSVTGAPVTGTTVGGLALAGVGI